jgi:hypothetical protein
MKIVALGAILAISLFTPAPAQPAQPGNVCLRQDMINGWDVVNDKTLIVTDRVGKKFTVSLMPGCLDLKFNLRLGFKAFGGTRLSCLGHNDYVLVPSGAGLPQQRCFISDVQAYNAASPPGAAATAPPK